MQSVLTSWVSGQGFGSVLAVLPLPTEADLSSPLRYWLDGGLTIALARMETPGLEFVKVVGLEGPWQPAGRSLRQPFPGEAWKPDSSRRTLLLVPGLAFAPGGSRLGRGGGYFDRFLAGSRPGVLALGYAFACQIAADLPTEPHDQPLDGLILGADSGILKAGVHLWH
jgi:5-formyltetrahydrofolate cyclo-ligase